MKQNNYVLLALLFALSPLSVLSQGLRIQGNNFLIDDRTNYTVFDKDCPIFKEKLTLQFELAPEDLISAYAKGYILRIKNEKENTTFNIWYDAQGYYASFYFNHEGKNMLIHAQLEKEELQRTQWIKFLISFDLQKDSLILQINDHKYATGKLGLKPEWKPCIHFGRSEHVIDIPSFCLRNLTVSDNTKEYFFPLNENEGEVVHDCNKKVMGHVLNPNWLINDAYYWKQKTSFHSTSVSGSIFNPESQEIYYVNRDSLIIYNVRSGHIHTQLYANECPATFRLGSCFIDKEKKRLYMYEVATPPSGNTTICYLDLGTFTWTAVSTDVLPTQLHHHNHFFDETKRRYILFGGFGNTLYNKEFYSYDLEANQWSTLKFGGDKITPRYFSSMGYQKSENALYLFGGMGNESGYQSVGRVYYYDLYKIDLNTNTITKLWNLQWDQINVVPVRNMLVTDDGYFYTLCYPEHFSKSQLKLYRFSLKDGTHDVMGDSIPILSEKITTNANLYYNENTNSIFSILMEFENDDIASTANVYSLAFPPVTANELTTYSVSKKKNNWLFFYTPALGILFLSMAYFALRKRKTKKAPSELTSLNEENPLHWATNKDAKELKANSIYLFGDFIITNRKGKDIGYMLSTKLKQAFFLTLQYSMGDGISSQEFSEILWPDKSEDKLKNSRGVTVNYLRKVLSELDGIKLIYEKGYFRLVFTEECYCDCIRCLDIASKSNIEPYMDEFMDIIFRGKFLKSADFSCLDQFKDIVERKIEPVLYVAMKNSFLAGDYAKTIQLSDGLFHIDLLNEDALYYHTNSLLKLKKREEAKKRYVLFANEYKRMMDTEYSKSFQDLTVK